MMGRVDNHIFGDFGGRGLLILIENISPLSIDRPGLEINPREYRYRMRNIEAYPILMGAKMIEPLRPGLIHKCI
jgi:hypothetical protein